METLIAEIVQKLHSLCVGADGTEIIGGISRFSAAAQLSR
jgi:hypothetical protein